MTDQSTQPTSSAEAAAALEVVGVDAGYGGLRVLSDVSFSVRTGSIVALMGGNGSGKTTVLRSVAGVIRLQGGAVSLGGASVEGWPAPRRVRAGLSFVGADSVFAGLRVREHFDLRRPLVEARGLRFDARVDEMLERFPVLRDRLDQAAGSMSGGERQTLALAAGLLTQPTLMLVDELSLGLAPSVVEQVLGIFPQVAADEGTAFLVVEQHPDIVLGLADELVILVHGGVAYDGSPDRFRSNPRELAEFYLGTGSTATT